MTLNRGICETLILGPKIPHGIITWHLHSLKDHKHLGSLPLGGISLASGLRSPSMLELNWIRNIEQHASDNVNKILVGNKADMDESKRGQWRGVDPVVFFKDDTIINSIRDFYGIDEGFPFNGHLITRNSDTSHVKRIYYVSKFVKDILELNFSAGQQLKITSVGMKMFERQTAREGTDAPCAFRISSEGLPLILPYITKQIIQASPVNFKHLLQDKDVKFTDFADAEFGKKAENLLPGCCVIVLGKGMYNPR
ncbi:hypothetical protein KIW84_061678 [Lathyrus oleraceus]|uniref:Uncharacterized protein n=1 Tax=Pisum sativum TaxID=3888 RepID=A0A9D5A786_PEA|nr:hypothetical protein KIW84_061678 [Pisum sativum]